MSGGSKDGEEEIPGKLGCPHLHRGFILFLSGCFAAAILIDSFDISMGMSARGERMCLHTRTSVHSPAYVVRFVAHPDKLCVHGWPERAPRERRGSKRENRKKE